MIKELIKIGLQKKNTLLNRVRYCEKIAVCYKAGPLKRTDFFLSVPAGGKKSS